MLPPPVRRNKVAFNGQSSTSKWPFATRKKELPRTRLNSIEIAEFVLTSVLKTGLPLSMSDAEELDPIVAVQSFYVMVEALARARGRDPDAPRHLAKITVTR